MTVWPQHGFPSLAHTSSIECSGIFLYETIFSYSIRYIESHTNNSCYILKNNELGQGIFAFTVLAVFLLVDEVSQFKVGITASKY